MLFNSLHFLIFFPIAFLLYYMMPPKYRWMLLLSASCYFYITFIPMYIFVLALLIFIDYYCALQIEKKRGSARKMLLLLSILSTCAVLFLFKYFNFLNANLAALADLIHWNYSLSALTLALPIGLSFHTFQSLGYVIDVYYGKLKAERHLGFYALYVMFFPQLVAGPIERAGNLLPQLHKSHAFLYDNLKSGLLLMLLGFFKKVVIADNLVPMVGQVFDNIRYHSGSEIFVAVIFFGIQIYCDFSGYSDIARGSAMTIGIRLMENFKRPFYSRSISEFWHRWHISLSTWFRDYLYIPLGGSRVSKARWVLNIMIVFILSGIWHGANWTFIVWGFLHGMYMIASYYTKWIRSWLALKTGLSKLPRVHSMLQALMVFILVNLGWVFFRADSLSDAFFAINAILSSLVSALIMLASRMQFYARHSIGLFVPISLLVFILLQEAVVRYPKLRQLRWLDMAMNVLSFAFLAILLIALPNAHELNLPLLLVLFIYSYLGLTQLLYYCPNIFPFHKQLSIIQRLAVDASIILFVIYVAENIAVLLGNSIILYQAYRVIAFAVIVMEYVHLMQENGATATIFNDMPLFIRWAAYTLLLISILIFGSFNETKFIYFQF